MTVIARLIQAALHPEPIRVRLLRPLLKRMTRLSYELRLQFDAVDRPWMGYGILNAARLAKRLGIPAISVIEFGVAGGNGLLCLEEHTREASKLLNVEIHVHGFDRGSEGLPPPKDHRDVPCLWAEGMYQMDEKALRGRLRAGTGLWLGDVARQLEFFAQRPDIPPVAAIMFDMDLYSSTVDSFKIFDLPDDRLLPRVFCFFDDLLNDPIAGVCDSVGQWAAISDFNKSSQQKIHPDRFMMRPRKARAQWPSQMYVHHRFGHERYGDFVGTENDQRRLT